MENQALKEQTVIGVIYSIIRDKQDLNKFPAVAFLEEINSRLPYDCKEVLEQLAITGDIIQGRTINHDFWEMNIQLNNSL